MISPDKALRLLLFPLALLLATLPAAAQSGTSKMELVPHAPPQVVPEPGASSDTLDLQPKPISLAELMKLKLNYPHEARENGQQGRVLLEFDVLTNGLVANIHIIKSSGFAMLDSEALRMTRIMEWKTYWRPGMKNGQAVQAPVTFPVVFKTD